MCVHDSVRVGHGASTLRTFALLEPSSMRAVLGVVCLPAVVVSEWGHTLLQQSDRAALPARVARVAGHAWALPCIWWDAASSRRVKAAGLGSGGLWRCGRSM